MTACPECGGEVGPGQRFCASCGARLPEGCPSCGAPVQPGQRFCAQCGAPLGAPEASPASAPASPSAAAEVRLVSVLFTDLVGFTSLSETRDAEDMRELLSSYFGIAREVVGRHGGTIEKFIGDAVMAVWGTPTAHEDDAVRAVRAGLEMVSEVLAFGERVGAPTLRARAGVVTGRAASWASSKEGLVVGDRVNTAQRVQSAATPGTVLVESLTREATDHAIEYIDAGSHQVKGKTEPIQLWQAVRRLDLTGRTRLISEIGTTLGRDSELAQVESLFEAVVDGSQAATVLISGPAGVGKSRVLAELVERFRRLKRGVLWHEAGCTSYGSEAAYSALSRIFRQRLGIAEDDANEVISGKLQRGLARYLPDAADRDFVAPKLGVLLGLPAPEQTPTREEFFAGWRTFVEGMAKSRPVVLAIDNLQWADSGLLDFLEHLVDVSAKCPLMVVALCRPELLERREGWAQRPGFAVLPLQRLSDQAIGGILDELVPGMPRASRSQVVSRAEGIPLYAVETVHMLAGRGLVVERDGVRTLTQELSALETPVSLEALIAARLDELGPSERSLLKDLAVLGLQFGRDVVGALSPLPAETIDGLLASLQRKEVLTASEDGSIGGPGFAFTQTLLRTVAYDRLGKRERRGRHLAVAAHLEGIFEGGVEEVTESVAAHLRDAYAADRGAADATEVGEKARLWLIRAAQRAAIVGAPERAAGDLLQAAELATEEADRLADREAAAELFFRAGQVAESLQLFEEVAAAHRDAGRSQDAARLEGEIGNALGRLGRAAEAAARLRPALAVLDQEPAGAAVARVCSQLGRELSIFGQGDEAMPYVERALQLAEEFDLPQVLCDALETKALLLRSSDRSLEALELFERTITIAESRGLASEELLSGHANSADTRIANDLPDAVSHLEAALTIARRLGQRYSENFLSGNLMLAQIFAGEWAEAEAVAAALLEEERHGQEILHSRLVLLHALRGDAAGARRELGHLGRWEHHDSKEPRTLRAALEGTVLLAEGDAAAALERSRGVLEEALPSFGLRHEITRQAWPDACEAARQLGDEEQLTRLTKVLAEAPPATVPPYLQAQLARYRGLGQGLHPGDGAALLSSAVSALAELGYPYWVARTVVDWVSLQDSGDGALPGATIAEANRELERLGVSNPGPRLASAGESRPTPVGS